MKKPKITPVDEYELGLLDKADRFAVTDYVTGENYPVETVAKAWELALEPGNRRLVYGYSETQVSKGIPVSQVLLCAKLRELCVMTGRKVV
jgi:hypothetical protein